LQQTKNKIILGGISMTKEGKENLIKTAQENYANKCKNNTLYKTLDFIILKHYESDSVKTQPAEDKPFLNNFNHDCEPHNSLEKLDKNSAEYKAIVDKLKALDNMVETKKLQEPATNAISWTSGMTALLKDTLEVEKDINKLLTKTETTPKTPEEKKAEYLKNNDIHGHCKNVEIAKIFELIIGMHFGTITNQPKSAASFKDAFTNDIKRDTYKNNEPMLNMYDDIVKGLEVLDKHVNQYKLLENPNNWSPDMMKLENSSRLIDKKITDLKNGKTLLLSKESSESLSNINEKANKYFDQYTRLLSKNPFCRTLSDMRSYINTHYPYNLNSLVSAFNTPPKEYATLSKQISDVERSLKDGTLTDKSVSPLDKLLTTCFAACSTAKDRLGTLTTYEDNLRKGPWTAHDHPLWFLYETIVTAAMYSQKIYKFDDIDNSLNALKNSSSVSDRTLDNIKNLPYTDDQKKKLTESLKKAQKTYEKILKPESELDNSIDLSDITQVYNCLLSLTNAKPLNNNLNPKVISSLKKLKELEGKFSPKIKGYLMSIITTAGNSANDKLQYSDISNVYNKLLLEVLSTDLANYQNAKNELDTKYKSKPIISTFENFLNEILYYYEKTQKEDEKD